MITATKEKAIAFFEHEAAGGIILMAAALLAMLLANSPLAHVYEALLDTPVSVQVGKLKLEKHLLHWINDGLMTIGARYTQVQGRAIRRATQKSCF